MVMCEGLICVVSGVFCMMSYIYGGDGDLFVVLGVWCCEGFNVKL